MKTVHPDLQTHPSFIFEREALQKGYSKIAGVDEVGRGPLAGPVVACACLLPFDCSIEGIDDSKKLSPLQREKMFYKLTQNSDVIYAIGIVEPSVIDEINILQASLLAMKNAVLALPISPDFLLVDGIHLPSISIPSQSIVSGDSRSFSIGGASIIAKFIRDQMMEEFDKEYPQYGFASHKGYGTKKHLEALEKYGTTPLHRLSFSPCFLNLKVKSLA